MDYQLSINPRALLSSPPNAYLLPLIPPNHPTPLSHFVQYFIPLSESLWELAEKSDKEAEKKVYRVLIDQIWATFPSYCWDCYDLQEVSKNIYVVDLC
jgi:ribosomal RNA-processing protein 12